MGISGHILGPRKLRKLVRETGMPFDRAYRRNNYGGGRVAYDGTCLHYEIDFTTMSVMPIINPTHWSSCT